MIYTPKMQFYMLFHLPVWNETSTYPNKSSPSKLRRSLFNPQGHVVQVRAVITTEFRPVGSTATVLRSYGGLKYTGKFLEDRPLPGFLSVAIYVQLGLKVCQYPIVIEKSVLLRSSSWTSLETSLLLKFWAYVLTKSTPRITRLQKLQPPSWLGTLPPSSRQCSWECNYLVAAGEITVV
jgi:hypothetical protein